MIDDMYEAYFESLQEGEEVMSLSEFKECLGWGAE